MAANVDVAAESPAAEDDARALEELSFKLTIVEARNLVGTAGPGSQFSATVATAVRGDVIETLAVPATEGCLHRFDKEQSYVFGLDGVLVNELVAQPLVFTLSQVEAKLGEKTPIGTAHLFLDKLLAQAKVDVWCPVISSGQGDAAAGGGSGGGPEEARCATSAEEAGSQALPEGLLPQLRVVVEVSRPLVGAEELDPDDGGLRVLEFRLDGVFALPPRWLLAEGQTEEAHPYAYTVTAAVPLGRGVEYTITFPDGILARGAQPPGMVGTYAGAAGAPDAASGAASAEDGDGTGNDGAEVEAAEAGPPGAVADPSAQSQAIVWPVNAHPARCILRAAEAAALKDLLEAAVPLRLRFARRVRRADQVDPPANQRKYAGVCDAQLGALADLDSTAATAVCRIGPEFPPEESDAVAGDVAMGAGGVDKGKGGSVGKAADKGKDKGADKGKGKGKDKDKAVPAELPVEDVEMPHPYDASATVLVLTATTDRPLFPRPPPPPPPVPKPSDLIPKRVLPSLQPRSANAEFRRQVEAVVASLLDEFSSMFGQQPLDDESPEARDHRRRQLLYELNNSGAYYALKERLKKAVVRIVRETFHKKDESSLPDGGDSDRFFADLYVHLVRLTHTVLHDTFYPPPPGAPGSEQHKTAAAVGAAMGGRAATATGGLFRAPIVPTSEPRLDQLLRLAEEMEAERAWDAGAALHEERLCLSENDAKLWLDYATFLLRAGRFAKAEAALREALSIAPEDVDALTAYGCTLYARDKPEEAEVYFRGAVDASPDSPLAWALLATLYTQQGRDFDAKRAFKQASSLTGSPEVLRLDLADRLVAFCAEPLVDVSLQLQLATDRKQDPGAQESSRMRRTRANVLLAVHRYEEAAALFGDLAAETPGAPNIWAGLGHARLGDGRAEAALDAYLHAIDGDPNGGDALVLLRAAQLTCRAAETAPPGPVQQAIALNSAAEAEEALSEACVLNNRNERVWAHLCLLTLRLDRMDEATKALAQALRLGLADTQLLVRIGADLHTKGDWAAAEDVLRRGVAAGGGARAQRLLADCLAETGAVTEAIQLYEEARDSADTEAELRHIKAKLSGLHQRVGRLADAQRAAAL